MRAFLLWGASLVLLASTADAQTACGDRSVAVDKLKSEYREVLTETGISGDGKLVQVFVSPEGSWTILATRPEDGLTCFIGSGEGWRNLEPENLDPKA